ncbi:MAG TPA: hypothetical protein V6D05_01800 [Stenomitos sp.]
MPRLVVPWVTNLGIPLLLLTLAWGCGGTATLVEPVKVTKASAAPRKPRPLKTPSPMPHPSPTRAASKR